MKTFPEHTNITKTISQRMRVKIISTVGKKDYDNNVGCQWHELGPS